MDQGWRRVARAATFLIFLHLAWPAGAAVPPSETFVIKLAGGYRADVVASALAAGQPSGVPGLDPILHDWMLTAVKPVFSRTGKAVQDPELFGRLGLDRYLVVGWAPPAPAQAPHVQAQILSQLRQFAQVEEAELNVEGRAAFTPNDPNFTNQWHHATIGSTQAWAITTGSTNVLIAVVDSGLSSTNADFNYALISNGYDYVEGDGVPEDEYGHGTHVAGIIAAQGNNGTDVVGLAWGCRLLIIRVIDEFNSCTWANTAAGIQEAADSGADVINLSIQGCGNSSVLSNAVAYAYGLDCVLAACMGNYDTSFLSFPGAYEVTIAVGMTTTNDARVGSACAANTLCTSTDFGSNVGPHLDVVAPGRNILSTLMSGSGVMSGTSMATPMVAALSGLFRELRPDYDNARIEELVRACGRDLVGDVCEDVAGYDEYMGYGRIQFGLGVTIAAASTNCALTYAAAMMAPPPPSMFATYYWLRDSKLKLRPLGMQLTKDYYRASPRIIEAALADAGLTFRLVNVARATLPVVDRLRTQPGLPLQVPRSLWRRCCNVVDELLAAVDPETRSLLEPWAERGRNEPVQLLADLGIPATLVGP